MTEDERVDAMRQRAREVLRELLPDMLDGLDVATEPRNGNGKAAGAVHDAAAAGDPVIPLVPAPPVAAVMRPSTWTGPAVPGEVVGDGTMRPVGDDPGNAPTRPDPESAPASGAPSDGTRVEAVTLDSDEDLQRFVAGLLRRFENPRDRRALRTGRLRFALRRSPGTPAPGATRPAQAPAMRIEKGAVTERVVREAAGAGARLVLARRAVLTPLARDQARLLRVAIEREDT
jgi:hypothetical protein